MRRLWLALLVLFCSVPVFSQAHHLTLRFNLEEMTAASETVFYGSCTKIEDIFEEQGGAKMAFTKYTFVVYETLHGKEVSEISFKSLGHRPPAKTGKPGEIYVAGKVWTKDSVLHDMPNYQVGGEYVIFLSPPDKWGLQVPTGRSQGSFQVISKPGGYKDVRNSMDNRSLFTTPYTGFALQKGTSIFPDDQKTTAGVFASIPDIDKLIQRRGAIELETFLDIVRIVVSGL